MKKISNSLQVVVENKNHIKTGGDIVGKILIKELSAKELSFTENSITFKILGERFINPFKYNKNYLIKNGIVLFNYYFDLASLILLVQSFLRKNKNIVSFHTFFKKEIIFIDILYSIKRFILLNFALFFADKLIFLTNAQKDFFQRSALSKKTFLQKSIIIHNGIDGGKILKDKINVSNEFNLIYIGRLVSQKGLNSISSLSEEKDLFSEFIIIGLGNRKYEKIFEKNNNLKYYKEIKNEDIYKYYDSSTALILPSYSEVFPMTVLEAMARGLIILVSDIPGMREIIKEGRNGYLFPPGDINKIKEIIFYLKNHPRKIRRISANNLKDVQKFTVKKQIQKYLKVYREILNKNETINKKTL